MKNKIFELYNSIGIISVFPITVYLVLLVPSTMIFAFTWLLSPFQPGKFSDLELLNK